ncbi:flagellin [candidate division KSB1 bacterium]
MGDLARINTNITALRAFQNLTNVNDRLVLHQERISTGKEVNRASDSPAGWYISRKLEAQATGNERLIKIIDRGIDKLQTYDSKFAQIGDILIEMADLANQALSDAVSSAEKQAVSIELRHLSDEIENILASGISAEIWQTFYVGDLDVSLSGVSFGTDLRLGTDDLTIEYATGDLIVTGTGLTSAEEAARVQQTVGNIEQALDDVLILQEQLGAYVSRLEFRRDNAQVDAINLQSSMSTIGDADLAREQLELTKLQILQQTSIAMLSQANQAPQSLLTLFGIR